MPEYKRFIAYFYEYINGKKQKNAGFAKVELRNGMWRILFRLTTDAVPEPPVQVYGFIRERGYLLGLPMGEMRSGSEISEEWAYRADSPIGTGDYHMENLVGIWIRSGEQRCFISVWDDDPVEVNRFVLELPKERKAEERMWKERTADAAEERQAADITGEEKGARTADEEGEGQAAQTTDIAGEKRKEQEGDAEAERQAAQATDIAGEKRKEQTVDTEGKEQVAETQMTDMAAEHQTIRTADMSVKEQEVKQDAQFLHAAERRDSSGCVEELLQKRQHFQPFQDQEITDCVQIMPCDVMRLQQEKRQVGRSSFLQHGYYQHRHLLLGRSRDGAYVLGVPGIRSQQEQYMAKMFGYDQFKMSRICDCGRVFGYWYRSI